MTAVTRADYEKALAEALSRHVASADGGRRIDRVAAVATAFHRKASLYQYEIEQQLADMEDPRPVATIGVAAALGVLSEGGKGPTRETRRWALTPEGRTVKTALRHNNDTLLRFAFTGLVLERDCDAYGLLLDVLDAHPGDDLHDTFRIRFEQNRTERAAWLEDAFPHRTLREGILGKMPWRPRPGHLSHSAGFGRRQAGQRLSWAAWMGHAERQTDGWALTPSGAHVVKALRAGNDRYTWLGPERGTQKALGVPEATRRGGPRGPSWNVLRPSRTGRRMTDVTGIADDVAGFMTAHYDDLRLVHANQAPVRAVLPYLYLREQQLGYTVDTDRVLGRILTRAGFGYLSSMNHPHGFYQITR